VIVGGVWDQWMLMFKLGCCISKGIPAEINVPEPGHFLLGLGALSNLSVVITFGHDGTVHVLLPAPKNPRRMYQPYSYFFIWIWRNNSAIITAE
jgi:hypothetical protein